MATQTRTGEATPTFDVQVLLTQLWQVRRLYHGVANACRRCVCRQLKRNTPHAQKPLKNWWSQRNFQSGLGLCLGGATELFCDSQSAIALSQNPVYHARTKHIAIKYHYIRELVANKEIALKYVSTTDNTADVLTKALPTPAHEKHVAGLGLVDLTSEPWRSKLGFMA